MKFVYHGAMELTLKIPHVSLGPSYLNFVEEMRANGDKIWEDFLPQSDESLEHFIARLIKSRSRPAPGRVAESTYWAVADGQVAGRICLRHRLNESLRVFGGHIGYEVRPSLRRKGIATEMLRAVLQTPKAREIGRILVTCAPDNVGSNKTILNNGGELEKTEFVDLWQRQTNYYWIAL